jgi:hypothetical protein
MDRNRGGAIAAAGVLAAGGIGHFAGPALKGSEEAGRLYVTPAGREFEVPHSVIKLGEFAVEHCLREVDAGRSCEPE